MKLTDEEKNLIIKEAKLLARAEFRDYMNNVRKSVETHERTLDMEVKNPLEAKAAALAIFSARLMKHPFRDPVEALRILLGEPK